MNKVSSIALQLGGLGLLILALSGLKSLPSKQVRSDLTLCAASKVTVPTTITVTGMIQSYEMKGVNSSLVLVSEDGCRLNVNASMDVLAPALNHIGKGDAYVKVSGEVKSGMITPKVGSEFSITEIVRRCGVPVYGAWEENGIDEGVVGYTKHAFNSMPVPISIKPEIKQSIPQDKVWREGCVEETNGIRQVVSVVRD